MGLLVNGKGVKRQTGPRTPAPLPADKWQCPERYCLLKDKRTVVSGDDPRAAYLLFPKGEIISVEDKAKWGLPLKSKQPVEDKAQTPPANKPRRGVVNPGRNAPPENKGETPTGA